MTTSNENIKKIVDKKNCSGCGTCAALCPNDAIKLLLDTNKGTYIPHIIEDKCAMCGLCIKICPFDRSDDQNNSKYQSIQSNLDDNSYLAYALNDEIRFNSSSGGAITAILLSALDDKLIDGAIVTKMSDESPFEPLPFLARSREEILESSGSKYCPVPINQCLKKILNSKKGEKFAVVGLPCHLYGIIKAKEYSSELREKIALMIGIFCSGTPSFNATKFVIQHFGLNSKDIEKISYRGRGWPGNMTIYLKDGTQRSYPYPSYWGNCAGFFHLPVCARCVDWFCKFADISCGDAWFDEIKAKDRKGTSLIISRGPKSDKLLKDMVEKRIIKIQYAPSNETIDSQLGYKKKLINACVEKSIFNYLKLKKCDQNQYKFLKLKPSSYIKWLEINIMRKIASRPRLWIILHAYYSFRNH